VGTTNLIAPGFLQSGFFRAGDKSLRERGRAAIHAATAGGWMPFRGWPAEARNQRAMLDAEKLNRARDQFTTSDVRAALASYTTSCAPSCTEIRLVQHVATSLIAGFSPGQPEASIPPLSRHDAALPRHASSCAPGAKKHPD